MVFFWTLSVKLYIIFEYLRMDKKKGKKINFQIAHCSSEDPEYPVSSLLLQTADAKGWQNKRFSTYPETIVIQLVQTSIINKIAILSHQSKIATKVQFEIRTNEMQEWKRLGRVSLDSNVNTNFQARELKQVNINEAEAKFIRLILRNNHVNNQNLFNQVGLISISFYGDRREDLPPVQERISMPKMSNEIDNITMNTLKQLQMKKKRAVQQQNYDLAQEFKQDIQKLTSNLKQIALLEDRKQQAIRRQNYDDAKIIKEQIQKLRGVTSQTQNNYRQPQQNYQQSQNNYNQNYHNTRQSKPSQHNKVQQQRQYQEQDQPMSKNTKVQPQKKQAQTKHKTQTANYEPQNHDQKPIRPKNNNQSLEEEMQNFNAQISKENNKKQSKTPFKVQKRKTQAQKYTKAVEQQYEQQRPVKQVKKPQRTTKHNKFQEELQGGNQFIQIPKKPVKNSNQVNEDWVCQFCKRVDKRFAEEDYKDMHYFNACPMLTVCNECGQAVQVSTLTYHLVSECANSKFFKKCPRCKEAVHQKTYKKHTEEKLCLPAKPLAANNRCPLCHLDINPGATGWKQHLVDQGCENNPRA